VDLRAVMWGPKIGVRVKTVLNTVAQGCGFAVFTLTPILPILLVLASCGGSEPPASEAGTTAAKAATQNATVAKPATRTVPPSVSYDLIPNAGLLTPPSGILTNPLNADPVAAQQGQMLFAAMNCDGCHGGGAVGFVGPSLVDGRWRYGGNDDELFHSIFYGRPRGMPAYGGILNEATVWQLITYVRSQPVPGVVPTATWQ